MIRSPEYFIKFRMMVITLRTAIIIQYIMKDKEDRSMSGMRAIELIKPGIDNEGTFFMAFRNRKTTREISDRKLSLELLSNLLWAAFGVNRESGPFGAEGRTAASASNSQEIDIYVALENGTYLYDAFQNRLVPSATGDLRDYAIGMGQSGLGNKAPVRLIYVADIKRLVNTAGYQEPGLHDPEIQKSYYYADTGMIAGNVYLFAASRGLAAWFHNCNKKVLVEKLNLSNNQRVLFGQTIGYPEEQ